MVFDYTLYTDFFIERHSNHYPLIIPTRQTLLELIARRCSLEESERVKVYFYTQVQVSPHINPLSSHLTSFLRDSLRDTYSATLASTVVAAGALPRSVAGAVTGAGAGAGVSSHDG
jgi:hypothetical protein